MNQNFDFLAPLFLSGSFLSKFKKQSVRHEDKATTSGCFGRVSSSKWVSLDKTLTNIWKNFSI